MTATQSGVEGRRTSRQEALNLIEEKRLSQLNGELKEGGSDQVIEFTPTDLGGGEDPDDAAAAAREEAAGQDTPEASAGQDTVAAGEDTVPAAATADIYDFLGEEKLSKTKVKIKVDGQEQEVVVADLLRDAQKHKAADKRLEEAALIRRQAETDAAEIRARAQAEAAAPKEQGEQLPKSDAFAKAVSLLFDGEPDQAGSEFSKAVNDEIERRVAEVTGKGTTVDVQALALQVRNDLAWDSALEKFRTDHSDIANDPHLLGMWQEHLNKVAPESHTQMEAVTKATELTRGWLNRVAGRSENTPSQEQSVLAKRQAAKDAASRLHVASSTSTRAPRGTQEAKPSTPTDVISEMKRARGQA